jgi:hypothetical protein
MRERRLLVRHRPTAYVHGWERGWDLAMKRIDGVPRQVKQQPVFQDCLTVLNEAFADGNQLQLELGVNALMGFCIDTVSKGDCKQWWN